MLHPSGHFVKYRKPARSFCVQNGSATRTGASRDIHHVIGVAVVTYNDDQLVGNIRQIGRTVIALRVVC